MSLRHVVAVDLLRPNSAPDGGDGASPDYLFDVVVTQSSSGGGGLVAVSTSGHEIKVYGQHSGGSGLALRQRLVGHTAQIQDLVLDASDPALLWSCGSDGYASVWDLRTGKAAMTFSSATVGGDMDPMLSVSVNAARSLVAVGCALNTDVTEARIKFWDVRNSGAGLAQFNESHSNDITRVRFHPTVPNHLVSASEDGLVGFYALTDNFDEEESLESVLQSEQNVSRVGFFGQQNEYIYCTTNVETVEIWHPMQAKKIVDFGDVRQASAAVNQPVDFVVDCAYNAASDELFLVGGSYDGPVSLFKITSNTIEPRGVLAGGHADRVRCAKWDFQHETLWTGGEDSRLCQWSTGAPAVATAAQDSSGSSSSKMRARVTSPHHQVQQQSNGGAGRRQHGEGKKSFSPY